MDTIDALDKYQIELFQALRQSPDRLSPEEIIFLVGEYTRDLHLQMIETVNSAPAPSVPLNNTQVVQSPSLVS